MQNKETSSWHINFYNIVVVRPKDQSYFHFRTSLVLGPAEDVDGHRCPNSFQEQQAVQLETTLGTIARCEVSANKWRKNDEKNQWQELASLSCISLRWTL